MNTSLGCQFMFNHFVMCPGQDAFVDAFSPFPIWSPTLALRVVCLCLRWHCDADNHSRSCTCGLWTVQVGEVTGVALFSFTSLGFFSKGIMGELFRELQRCLSRHRASARLPSYTGLEVEDFWSVPHWSIYNPSCKRRPQSGGIKSNAPLLSAQTNFLINYICECKVVYF